MITGPEEFERVGNEPDFYELYFGEKLTEEDIANLETFYVVDDVEKVIKLAQQTHAEVNDRNSPWMAFVRPRNNDRILTFVLKEDIK